MKESGQTLTLTRERGRASSIVITTGHGILTSCKPHRVTSVKRSNSTMSVHFKTLLIFKPLFKAKLLNQTIIQEFPVQNLQVICKVHTQHSTLKKKKF